MSESKIANLSASSFNNLFTSVQEAQVISKICTSSALVKDLDSLIGVVGYKTLDHVIIHGNKKLLDYNSFKNVRQLEGKMDTDLIWQDYAHIYHKQERDALKGHVYSALHPGKDTDGRDFLFFNRKYPWKNEQGETIGIICHSIEIEDPYFIELGSLLKKQAIAESTGIHYLNKNSLPFGFSQRESECLFYLVRGKTAKSIAKILGISNRTVETHIEHLKNKLKCHSKSELIEAAINYGFVQVIPNSLFSGKLFSTLKEID